MVAPPDIGAPADTRLPKVTACLPAYNAEAFIEKTLASLAAQTYPSLEIIISVDLSTDQTGEICDRFAAQQSNVTVLHQTEQQGWVGNVNTLLRCVRGDYLFFAFHDDPLKPTYVERLVAALQRHPEAILAFSDVEVAEGFDAPGKALSYDAMDGLTDPIDRAHELLINRRPRWAFPNRGLFRARAAEQIGGLHRHWGGEYSADLPWLLHMALLGEFVRVPEPLIRKVYWPGSLARGWRPGIRQSTGVLMSCARAALRAPLPWSDRLRVLGLIARRAAGGLGSRLTPKRAGIPEAA